LSLAGALRGRGHRELAGAPARQAAAQGGDRGGGRAPGRAARGEPAPVRGEGRPPVRSRGPTAAASEHRLGGAQKKGLALKPARRVPQFFERAAPNALHQVDLLEDEKTACGTVHGVFYLDDHSRYCLAGEFFFDKAEERVLSVGLRAVQEHGLPVEIL